MADLLLRHAPDLVWVAALAVMVSRAWGRP